MKSSKEMAIYFIGNKIQNFNNDTYMIAQNSGFESMDQMTEEIEKNPESEKVIELGKKYQELKNRTAEEIYDFMVSNVVLREVK